MEEQMSSAGIIGYRDGVIACQVSPKSCNCIPSGEIVIVIVIASMKNNSVWSGPDECR